jgi:hypothetical protein
MNKITTIEDLAAMINTHMASKEDIQRVEARLDRIEHLLLAKQEQCLTDLEVRMKKFEDALAV